MSQASCNCKICAAELDLDSDSIAIFNNYKICKACLDRSDPTDDYNQARQIVVAYYSNPIKSFKQAQKLINCIKK